MQGPHLGGWDRAASPLSLPGQMAPVAAREGGALEGKKVEGGKLSAVPEWPPSPERPPSPEPPHLETTCSWLTPVSSVLATFSLLHTDTLSLSLAVFQFLGGKAAAAAAAVRLDRLVACISFSTSPT